MLELDWLRDDAPYMPIVVQGLLTVLQPHDANISAAWSTGTGAPVLTVATTLERDEIARAVLQAPLPDVAAIAWPTRNPQALGPSLAATDDPQAAYRTLIQGSGRAGAAAPACDRHRPGRR